MNAFFAVFRVEKTLLFRGNKIRFRFLKKQSVHQILLTYPKE